jgi:site-specific DNA-methyltransferase (adenine-specific)
MALHSARVAGSAAGLIGRPLNGGREMNRLICGDCALELKKLPDRCVDLVCTDPPYIVAAQGRGLAASCKYLKEISARKMEDGFDLLLLNEFLRVLKTPNLILFCSRLQLREYLNWANDLGLRWALICWHKTNPTPLTNNNYLPDTEYILHFWRDRKLGGSYKTKRRFYVQAKERHNFPHPTVKPLNIVMNLIENATRRGDVVLDPFLGSGTTAVAAKMLGRHFIGIEREKEYIALARKRVG